FTFNYLGKTDANEPNDSVAAATPIAYGEARTGVIWPCEDVDYYAFDALANDEIEITAYGDWQLFDAGQHVVAESSEYWESRYVFLPAGGRYTLRIIPYDGSMCDWAGRVRVGLLGNSEPNDTIQRATPIAYG